jgi:outer membrane protein assembly factor BamB
MKTLLTIVIASFFLVTSCRKEEIPNERVENGIVVSRAYNWKKSLHQNGIFSNSSFDIPIVYNGNIAIPTTSGENIRQMTLLNPDNGDFIWSWDDRFQPETERIGVYYCFQNNNLLTYQTGDRRPR